MRRLVQNFWFRLGLVFLIGMGLYIFIILIPRLRHNAQQQIPKKHLIEFRAEIDQNYITYQALANQNSSGNTTSLNLSAAEQNVRDSLQKLNNTLSHRPKQITPDQIKQLKQITQQESNLLASYSSRFITLQKPLEYIPEQDLSTSNKSLAITRAKAAYKALLSLANTDTLQLVNNGQNSPNQQLATAPSNGTMQLSKSAQTTLFTSANCFNTYATQLQSNSKSTAKTLIKCTNAYKSTRYELVRLVTEPLRDKPGKDIHTKFMDMLQKIDKLIR